MLLNPEDTTLNYSLLYMYLNLLQKKIDVHEIIN
jgi:hypothetical protein